LGTPTTAGTFTSTITVTDAASASAFDVYTIKIFPPLTSLPTETIGEVGVPSSTTPLIEGGAAPYSWVVIQGAGLWSIGLSIDPNTLAITGTPTAPASF